MKNCILNCEFDEEELKYVKIKREGMGRERRFLEWSKTEGRQSGIQE